MGVSRKEFDELKAGYGAIWQSLEKKRCAIEQLHENMATLTKQMKCECENYEVFYDTSDSGCWIYEFGYKKVCLDCGLTTHYDTKEEALADKELLLDKQIDALKEQKKSLKKTDK